MYGPILCGPLTPRQRQSARGGDGDWRSHVLMTRSIDLGASSSRTKNRRLREKSGGQGSRTVKEEVMRVS